MVYCDIATCLEETARGAVQPTVDILEEGRTSKYMVSVVVSRACVVCCISTLPGMFDITLQLRTHPLVYKQPARVADSVVPVVISYVRHIPPLKSQIPMKQKLFDRETLPHCLQVSLSHTRVPGAWLVPGTWYQVITCHECIGTAVAKVDAGRYEYEYCFDLSSTGPKRGLCLTRLRTFDRAINPFNTAAVQLYPSLVVRVSFRFVCIQQCSTILMSLIGRGVCNTAACLLTQQRCCYCSLAQMRLWARLGVGSITAISRPICNVQRPTNILTYRPPPKGRPK